MDTKLQWKQHTEEIRRKATKTVNALSCLGGSNWGASLMDMRRIYAGTVLPQVMYACSVWSNASAKGRLYTKRTLNTLKSLQARAARAICGAYKATSNAALDVEAYLLPIKQQIWRHNADTVTRLLLSTDIAAALGFQTSTVQLTAANKARIRHTSSWQKVHSDMVDKRNRGFERQEQIPCFLTLPWRRGLTTYIDKTA
jgi:hypothetical protein